jgi:hypothetical protein
VALVVIRVEGMPREIVREVEVGVGVVNAHGRLAGLHRKHTHSAPEHDILGSGLVLIITQGAQPRITQGARGMAVCPMDAPSHTLRESQAHSESRMDAA